MNASNMKKSSGVVRDPRKIVKVDFERAPFSVRFKEKYFSLNFVKKVIWYLFRLVLLIGITYLILFPYISDIAGSFMEPQDFIDVEVFLIPKNFTLDTYTELFEQQRYMEAFGNTLFLSVSCAILQTLSCCLVGYGFAKFKFKGSKAIFILVMLTMIIPNFALDGGMFTFFNRFDVRGPISAITNGPGFFKIIGMITANKELAENGLALTNTYFPLLFLSMFSLGFKNALYIFMFRQFFRGVPDELEESAYMDGSGVFKTFQKIILPLSLPMLITVFLLSFSWQWVDTFYTNLFFRGSSSQSGIWLFKDFVFQMGSSGMPPVLFGKLDGIMAAQDYYKEAINSTAALMLLAPLIVLYVFCQKFLVQGIERSGLTAD